MNVDDLRGFIATAETGAVGAAADSLGISQPTLSRRIQRVEKAAGASLFDRVGHRVVLNSRGAGFLPTRAQPWRSFPAGPRRSPA